MYLYKKVADLQLHLQREKKAYRSIGFVPTMGALHEGHLSLIEAAKAQADVVVCSIFVNPTQFNDTKDLEKYPRDVPADMQELIKVENDVLFVPEVSEVYPAGLDTSLNLDLQGLDEVMEGAFRPGHFDGMTQVVWRLLSIVQPDYLFMGQKDFQQLTIVRRMLTELNSAIELVSCPIRREADGLAMSSRNRRLSPEERSIAPVISQILEQVKEKANDTANLGELSQWASQQLVQAGFRPDYFSIVDGKHLQEVPGMDSADFIVACTAAWLGEIRLIDNLILKP